MNRKKEKEERENKENPDKKGKRTQGQRQIEIDRERDYQQL